jgi:hypothetical protein
MQGGHLTSPAKSDWISIIWTGLSLLQEQGGYYSLAGRINRTIASIGVMDLVRSRVTVTSNSPLARGELLRLAGVAPSDKKAAEAWLSDAIELAQSMYRAVKQRPLPVDHNALLADIEKSAQELAKRIERLRRHPIPWHAFWRASVFGPVHHNRVEVPDVLSTLAKVVTAAGTAKDRGKGRRREFGKQRVVDMALAFFDRFSAHTASGTPTGAFARLTREFDLAVTGVAPEDHSGLDRQIREAVRRQSITRPRAQRKSAQ